jgi:hypothetical protein
MVADELFKVECRRSITRFRLTLEFRHINTKIGKLAWAVVLNFYFINPTMPEEEIMQDRGGGETRVYQLHKLL